MSFQEVFPHVAQPVEEQREDPFSDFVFTVLIKNSKCFILLCFTNCDKTDFSSVGLLP